MESREKATNSMKNIMVRSLSLRQLKKKFEDREFAIPEIQRQFVWNEKRVCSLMDSIFKNYPIGIFLIWKAKYTQAISIRPNNMTVIPPFNKSSSHADLVIDGQQRLSTIYAVLHGEGDKPDARSSIDFKKLNFDCDRNSERRFIFSKRDNEVSKGQVPLYDVLSSRIPVLTRRYSLNKNMSKEVGRCQVAFRRYRFHLLTFECQDFQDVKEIFIRINSEGVTVKRADTLFTKASHVSLRHHVIETKRGLRNGFDGISDDAIQATLALSYGATKIGTAAFTALLKKLDSERMGGVEFQRKWRILQYGYAEAVDFLVNTLGVSGLLLLPSQNIYSMLAYFFFLNNARAKPNQIREIKKWFWHTACGNRYSGSGFNRNIPSDIRFFQRLAEGGNVRYNIDRKLNPGDFIRSNYRNTGTSATKAYFILLRSLKPKYLLNGNDMLLDGVTSISNRKDRHHIFPEDFLRKRGVNEKLINSLANICFLEADENQSFGNRPPKEYLSNYRRKKHFSRVMKSHLIPYDRSSPLWINEFKASFIGLLNSRGRNIINAIENTAGVKMFDRFEPIKRL